MTVTSPKLTWMRVADTVRRFYNLLLWRGEFYFDVVGNFEPTKIIPNCNALAKSIISYLGVSYFPFNFLDSELPCYLQTKKHAMTSLERAHCITWYKQKRCHDDVCVIIKTTEVCSFHWMKDFQSTTAGWWSMYVLLLHLVCICVLSISMYISCYLQCFVYK